MRAVTKLALGVEDEGKPAPNTPYALTSRFPIPDSRFPIPVPLLGGVRGGFRFPIPKGASPKSCLTRWCVTGRAIQSLATRRKMRPPLKHH
ncbi:MULTISPECIES: hypothetical protein [Moorena]|uniref:hypothetical protein n=1 Tax=Moorena TaxID=1155738 RepID=UPI000312DD5C|nr:MULTISPECIES: hypothetical protein [Moorena]NEP67227.1 hypothetical protein [Moorena sp. SIO3A5]NEQ12380.1 hypothetical protein [Moorena sp. SIO3E2]NER86573.1 hypothetical protein [Moorena sp. SIO3A2]NES40050.1 hypothetical protein [Moorena sp. SIO2C4]